MFMIGAMSVSKVYIGNLAEDARYCCQNNSLIATPIENLMFRDRDIEKLFKGYGRVRNIVVKV